MGSIWTTEKGNENPMKAGRSELYTTHKRLKPQDAATYKAMDNLQDHEHWQPIPIEELKSGEFYDIQSIDDNPIVLGALLLEQLPNNRAKLMLMNSSDRAHFTMQDTRLTVLRNSLQIEAMKLSTVYPYHTFNQLPSKILHWPNNYEGEELITQIKEEMRRAMCEGCWTLNLPHFFDGYLHIYLSYIRWIGYCLRRVELVDLWFEFMSTYFSVLRDHILRVKLLPRETISYLLKALKGMDQMSEMSWKLSENIPNSSFTENEQTLANRKKSFFDSYRPRVLSSGVFDRFWQCLLQEYHQDLATWQRQEPLSLGDLLINSPKLTQILNRYRNFVKNLMDFAFPELRPEECLRLKFRIAAATNSFNLAEAIFTQSRVSPEEICLIILEEELLDSILRSTSERMKTFVLTRTEFFPLLLAYINSTDIPGIELFWAFQSLTSRIGLEDWEFVSFAIKWNTLANVYLYLDKNPDQTYTLIKRLLEVCLQHKMRPKLLRNLLPCVDYGHLVFRALVEMFSHPHCRKVMIGYFRPDTWHADVNNPRVKQRILSFLESLAARIALKDWEFINFVIQNDTLRPGTSHSLLGNQEVYEDVKKIVNAVLEHNMSPELLRYLLPYADYGYLIFPALVEVFSPPKCREAMIAYFRSQQLHTFECTPNKIIKLLTLLIHRTALEDLEFVNFIAQSKISKPTTWGCFLKSPEAHENVKELVSVALEHKLSSELLRNLLPCVDYGHLVFQILANMFSHPKCREVMIAYFRPDAWHADVNNPRVKQRILSFLESLATRIALKDWEFITFVIQNDTLRPGMQPSLLENQETYENVNKIVNAALEHNMSPDLLRNLLPCSSYGHLVLPALIKMYSHPKCREVMIAYFRHQRLYIFESIPDMIIKLLKLLKAGIALEDWEFVNFITQSQILRPTKAYYFLENLEVYENVKELVSVALEHKISAERLRGLLPCEDYGYLIFSVFAKGFLRSRSFQAMINYFGSELQCIDIARDMVMPSCTSEGQLKKREGQENICTRNTKISKYLQNEKLNLWYVFAGSVEIQIIWMRQYSLTFLKRLSPSLIREISSFLG